MACSGCTGGGDGGNPEHSTFSPPCSSSVRLAHWEFPHASSMWKISTFQASWCGPLGLQIAVRWPMLEGARTSSRPPTRKLLGMRPSHPASVLATRLLPPPSSQRACWQATHNLPSPRGEVRNPHGRAQDMRGIPSACTYHITCAFARCSSQNSPRSRPHLVAQAVDVDFMSGGR